MLQMPHWLPVAVWSARTGEASGMGSTVGMLVAGGVTLALLGALGIALALLWRAVIGAQQALRTLTETVAAMATGPGAPDPLSIQRLHEDPLPTGKAALDFWRAVHALPHWHTLSNLFQAETRTALRDGKQAAEANNQTQALVCLGKAEAFAFLAVRPEWESQRIVRALTAQQRQAAEDAATGQVEGNDTGRRPGARWGEAAPDE